MNLFLQCVFLVACGFAWGLFHSKTMALSAWSNPAKKPSVVLYTIFGLIKLVAYVALVLAWVEWFKDVFQVDGYHWYIIGTKFWAVISGVAVAATEVWMWRQCSYDRIDV